MKGSRSRVSHKRLSFSLCKANKKLVIQPTSSTKSIISYYYYRSQPSIHCVCDLIGEKVEFEVTECRIIDFQQSSFKTETHPDSWIYFSSCWIWWGMRRMIDLLGVDAASSVADGEDGEKFKKNLIQFFDCQVSLLVIHPHQHS